MQVKKYNHQDFSENSIVHDILDFRISEIENGNFDKAPTQSDVLKYLRAGGWDEKIRTGRNCSHSIDGVLDGVGTTICFGHAQAAFQKLLVIQSLYLDQKLTEAIIITQSAKTARIRHVQSKKDKSKTGNGNGNRITLKNLISAMEYYSRFITIPLTIIGIEYEQEN
tara:strand:+ start:4695 stop:5195 length:501 start_codon:yes stop_codon:yes gene_type:complete